MSRIIKGNLAKAMDFKKIEPIKFSVIEIVGEVDEVANVQNFELTPEEMLRDAKAQGQSMIAAAEKEAQFLREQAIEEGFKKGYQEGYEQGKQKISNLEDDFRDQFSALIQDFYITRQTLLDQASKEVQEVTLFITKKLVGDLIEEKDDLVLDLYKMLLPMISDKNITEIITNPQDNHLIEDYIKFINKYSEMKLSISPEIDKGSVKVVTEQGYIEQNLNTQLDELIKELRKLNG